MRGQEFFLNIPIFKKFWSSPGKELVSLKELVPFLLCTRPKQSRESDQAVSTIAATEGHSGAKARKGNSHTDSHCCDLFLFWVIYISFLIQYYTHTYTGTQHGLPAVWVHMSLPISTAYFGGIKYFPKTQRIFYQACIERPDSPGDEFPFGVLASFIAVKLRSERAWTDFINVQKQHEKWVRILAHPLAEDSGCTWAYYFTRHTLHLDEQICLS